MKTIAQLTETSRPESERAFDVLLREHMARVGPEHLAAIGGTCPALCACRMDELVPERCATCLQDSTTWRGFALCYSPVK